MSADHPTHEVRTPPRSPLNRLARKVAIVVLGALALVVLSALATMRYFAIQRDPALDRIRAAGDPVFAADIPPDVAPNAATLAWLRELTLLRETVADDYLLLDDDPPVYRRNIAALTSSDVPLELRDAVAAFDRAVQSDAQAAGGGDAGLRKTLANFQRAWTDDFEHGLAPSQIAWLELQAVDGASRCELAARCGDLPPITLRDRQALFPEEPVWSNSFETAELHAIGRALVLRAELRVARGDAAGALADARAILAVAQLGSHALNVFEVEHFAGLYAWHLFVLEALLRAKLVDADDAVFAKALSTEPLVEALRAAARAERALWNEHCASTGTFEPLFFQHRGLSALPARAWCGLTRARNQSWVLGEYERQLPAIELPRAARATFEWDTPRPWGARFGEFRFVAVGRALDAIDADAARIAFLHVERARRRGGVDAAEATARASIDPFSGGPLRCERRAGELRVWSVGPNGIDEGGASNGELRGTDDVLRTWRDG